MLKAPLALSLTLSLSLSINASQLGLFFIAASFWLKTLVVFVSGLVLAGQNLHVSVATYPAAGSRPVWLIWTRGHHHRGFGANAKLQDLGEAVQGSTHSTGNLFELVNQLEISEIEAGT